MRYEAVIKVFGDPEKITKCFAVEVSKQDRSEFTIDKKDDHVVFDVKAADPVALRAILNSISKLLSVYEQVVENGQGN